MVTKTGYCNNGRNAFSSLTKITKSSDYISNYNYKFLFTQKKSVQLDNLCTFCIEESKTINMYFSTVVIQNTCGRILKYGLTLKLGPLRILKQMAFYLEIKNKVFCLIPYYKTINL